MCLQIHIAICLSYTDEEWKSFDIGIEICGSDTWNLHKLTIDYNWSSIVYENSVGSLSILERIAGRVIPVSQTLLVLDTVLIPAKKSLCQYKSYTGKSWYNCVYCKTQNHFLPDIVTPTKVSSISLRQHEPFIWWYSYQKRQPTTILRGHWMVMGLLMPKEPLPFREVGSFKSRLNKIQKNPEFAGRQTRESNGFVRFWVFEFVFLLQPSFRQKESWDGTLFPQLMEVRDRKVQGPVIFTSTDWRWDCYRNAEPILKYYILLNSSTIQVQLLLVMSCQRVQMLKIIFS